MRAERKAGELLTLATVAGELAGRGGDRKSESRSSATTLKDVGISADQSARWKQLASMPDEHFETAVATAKDTAGQVTTAFMLREAEKPKPARPQRKPVKGAKADATEVRAAAIQPRSTARLVTPSKQRHHPISKPSRFNSLCIAQAGAVDNVGCI